MTYQAMGQAITMAINTSFMKSKASILTIPVVLAPNTLLTPISFILLVAACADRPKSRQMMNIQKSLDNIDKLCCNGEDSKAFREFYNLCKENNFSRYKEMSISILARYADYEKKLADKTLKEEEMEVFINRIRADFRIILAGFRAEYSFKEDFFKKSIVSVNYFFHSIIVSNMEIIENVCSMSCCKDGKLLKSEKITFCK